MGKVTIIEKYTPKNPITMIGELAGICWRSDTSDPAANYKRGMGCFTANHGRTIELPDVYTHISGYSAKVIREWYTHIGGAPTRLQESTRYINYSDFNAIVPPSIKNNKEAFELYMNAIRNDAETICTLKELGIPNEDATMLLPMAYSTGMIDKRNWRNLMDMSRNRMCSRAYWEYKNELFHDYKEALENYSEECKTLVSLAFKPKCEVLGYCPESAKDTCGRKPRMDELKDNEINRMRSVMEEIIRITKDGIPFDEAFNQVINKLK